MTSAKTRTALLCLAILCAGCVDVQQRQYNEALRNLSDGNLAVAAKSLTSLATNGHPLSQFRLGIMLLHGMGMKQNLARAAYWFEKAANQGDLAGRYSLARLYLNGVGVAKNPALSRRYLLPLAEQGFVPAQLQLGLLLDAGIGGERDVENAQRWIRSAAERHHPRALEAMAQAYEKGLLGFSVDQDQAKYWRDKAKPRYF